MRTNRTSEAAIIHKWHHYRYRNLKGSTNLLFIKINQYILKEYKAYIQNQLYFYIPTILIENKYFKIVPIIMAYK